MHDRNGTPLKVGDTVVLPMRIMSLGTSQDFCNVTLESLYGRRPDGQKETVSAINTGVLIFHDRDEPGKKRPEQIQKMEPVK